MTMIALDGDIEGLLRRTSPVSGRLDVTAWAPTAAEPYWDGGGWFFVGGSVFWVDIRDGRVSFTWNGGAVPGAAVMADAREAARWLAAHVAGVTS